MTRIGDFFANVDNGSEYVPVASTVTSVVDFFVKIGLLFASDQTIKKSHYYKHLKDKSFGRCLLLAVPVLGNVSVGLYDKFKKVDYTSYNEVLRQVKKDGNELEHAPAFQNDPTIVDAAVSKKPESLQFADRSQQLRIVTADGSKLAYVTNRQEGSNYTNDNQFVDAACLNNATYLRYASRDQQIRKITQGNTSPVHATEDYQNDPNFVNAIFTARPQVLPDLKEDQRTRLINRSPTDLQYASREQQLQQVGRNVSVRLNHVSEEYRNDNDFVDAAVVIFNENLQHTSRDQQVRSIGVNPERIKGLTQAQQLEVLRDNNGLWLEHVVEDLKDNEGFVNAATLNNPVALKFASDAKQLRALEGDGLKLQYVREDLKGDMGYVGRAYGNNSMALQYAAEGAQLEIVNDDIRDLQYASKEIQLRKVTENGLNLQYVAERFKNDDEFVNPAFNNDRESLKFASLGAQRRKINSVKIGIEKSITYLKFASKTIQVEYIQEDGKYLEYAADACKDDEVFVRSALIKNKHEAPHILKFASQRVQEAFKKFAKELRDY